MADWFTDSLNVCCLYEQVPSSPPPLAAPIARRLSVSASVAGEEGLMSCVLPEDLIVEILSDRLQVSTISVELTYHILNHFGVGNIFSKK